MKGIFPLIIVLILLACGGFPVNATQYDPPWADNYQFAYLDGVTTIPCAANAASYQSLVSYDGHSFTNSSANSAYVRMADDAIFSFIGHGDNGALETWNGSQEGLILAEDLGYYPVGISDYSFISDYQEELDDELLAVYISCYSADDSPYVGNLVTESYQKGVDVVLGFNGIVGVPHAKTWSNYFWLYEGNYEWSVQLPAQSAAYNVLAQHDSYNGTNNWTISGSGGTRISPARYGE